jgi:hypothetical protein
LGPAAARRQDGPWDSCPRENRHAPARLSLLAGIKELLGDKTYDNKLRKSLREGGYQAGGSRAVKSQEAHSARQQAATSSSAATVVQLF